MIQENLIQTNILKPALILLILLISSLSGCTVQGEPEQSNITMIAKPFFDTKKVPESPEPPFPSWTGILIQSEMSHLLSMKKREVVINGYYRLNGSEYPLNDDDLRIHAVNTANRMTYESGAGQKDDSPVEPDEPGPPLSRDDIRDMVFSGYFNTDILLTLKLPVGAAKYRVWVAMGPVKSNEILLEISVK